MAINALRWRAAAVLALAACTMGPDFDRSNGLLPADWFADRPPSKPVASQAVAEPIDPRWWSAFNDAELTALEERVARGNLDVRAATIRLAESRAQRGIAAADQFPTARGNASYTRERISEKGVVSLFSGGGAATTPAASLNGLGGTTGGIPTPQGRSPQPFSLWQYGFDASWELDLWGRVRRAVESADASVDASAEAQRGTLLSTVAEVASDYIRLRGAQTQLQIARDNRGIAQQSLRLTQQRSAGGVGTDLDVANAAAQLRSTEAQIPALEQQEAQLINALSLLLGQQPNALRAELEQARPVPPVPPRVPVGIPSELARRRPDIRQAEAQLHAATAEIGVAEASFYPTVTLSGSLSLQALRFKDLGSWGARQYGLGPSITLPIFEGGKLTATLELRQAEQQEAAVNYQKTVLGAWHEVDNALTAYAAEQERRTQLAQAVTENRRALGLAQSRYQQGLADFLQVLDAQRSLLAAQLQLADSTTTVANDLVTLYKALGGGWEPDLPASR